MSQAIDAKTVSEVVYIAGFEPAGIALRIIAEDKTVVTYYVPRQRVASLRDMLQNALDNHLPKN